MNPRSNKTPLERVVDWWRGLFAQPSRNHRSTSGGQDTPNQTDQSGVLGDLPDTERVGDAASRGRRDAADKDTTAPNADIERQDDVPSASGASDDEFRAGGYRAGVTDPADVEEAAETDGADAPSDAPGATGSYRSMTGGNEPADDSGWTVGGSTSAAEDSGSVASRGSGLDEPATIESDTPTMTGSGTDHTGSTAGADMSGSEDNATSEVSRGSADSEAGDATQQSADQQEADLDRSMQGDTDYVTAGYPSESMDIDITDTDDLGVEDAESTDDADDSDDDAADFSEDVGELGLADSETVDGVANAGTTTGGDESGFTPVSPDDVGVGVGAEVDDTSRIANTDDATSAEVRDAADTGEAGGRGESPAAAAGGSPGATGGPAGSVRGDGTTNTPDGHPIKGNASSKIYHMPGMPSYAGTKAEWCFASEKNAIAAGYRAPAGRNRGKKQDTGPGGGDGSPNDASGRGQRAAGGSTPSSAASGSESEGMQSFASTADRDALSDMQDTLAEEPDASDAVSAQGLGGVGSDPSAADDPTSVGVASPATGDSRREHGAHSGAAPSSDSSGNGGGLASQAGSDEPADQESDVEQRAASDDLASVGATTDPAQAAAADISSMQTDTIEQASAPDDSGLPADTDEPEGVGANASDNEQTYAGAVRGDGSKSCPADYPIKGNAGSMIYHAPGRASYDGTVPEWCFATEEDAVNAGFRAPKR